MKRLALLGVVPAFLFLACCQQHTVPITSDSKVAATTHAAPMVPLPVDEIIVDDAADKPAFTTEGEWNVSAGGNDYKDQVHWAKGNSDAATSTAKWTPTIATAGTYAVYEHHGEDPSSDHASNEAFTINYDGGSKTVEVNLKDNINKWNLLGTFKFAAGTSGTITVTNKANGNVLADAVRLVKEK